MCVIIDRLEGETVPFEKLLSAACRNYDGWGIITVDRGQVEVRKGLTEAPGKTADTVARIMEDSRDARSLLHFRLRTVGDVSLDNLHPYTVLEPGQEFDVGLYLMHNGTLSDFSSGWDATESDTSRFVRELVTPLSILIAEQHGPEHILEDPLFQNILSHYSGSASKLVLVDSKGSVLTINRSAGIEQPWGWASNEYSFKDKPTNKDWKDSGRSAPVTKVNSAESCIIPWLADGTVGTLAGRVLDACENSSTTIADYAPRHRPTACGLLGLDSLDAFNCLDEHELFRIFAEEPSFGVLLVLDLLHERYQSKKEGL